MLTSVYLVRSHIFKSPRRDFGKWCEMLCDNVFGGAAYLLSSDECKQLTIFAPRSNS